MLQAIVTKYIGPTNVKGSRVKAVASAGSVTRHWDDALNSQDNHIAAAKALAAKFDWTGEWHGGALPEGKGYCFVQGDIGQGPLFVTHGKPRKIGTQAEYDKLTEVPK